MSKSTLVYFLVVAGIVGFFYWLGQRDKPLGPPATVAVATPTPAPPPAPVPAAARPAQAAPPAPATMIDNEKVQRLAARARVEVLRFDVMGSACIVEVRWVSDVATQGTEFMDLLRLEGMIRMYEAGNPALRAQITPDGRRAFISQFKAIF